MVQKKPSKLFWSTQYHIKGIPSQAVLNQCADFIEPSEMQALASYLIYQSHLPCHQGPGCTAEAPANIGTFQAADGEKEEKGCTPIF